MEEGAPPLAEVVKQQIYRLQNQLHRHFFRALCSLDENDLSESLKDFRSFVERDVPQYSLLMEQFDQTTRKQAVDDYQKERHLQSYHFAALLLTKEVHNKIYAATIPNYPPESPFSPVRQALLYNQMLSLLATITEYPRVFITTPFCTSPLEQQLYSFPEIEFVEMLTAEEALQRSIHQAINFRKLQKSFGGLFNF